jgi:RNA polymerase sigma factor (sigma-70 family)
LVHTARTVCRDYDATMDAYAYLLEQLRRDDCQRLRSYVADGRGKFTTWLVVVARRLCIDYIRHRYGREARSSRRNLVDLLAEELDPADLADPTTPDPEASLRVRELSGVLDGALGALDSRDRLLLKLRFEDDLPARQIGLIMGFATPFHVYRRLNALLERLRTALGRRGVQGPEP